VDDAEDVDAVRFADPVEHGVRESPEERSPDGFVAHYDLSAAWERHEAGEQAIELVSELLVYL
jgi:hypothetical protein